MENATLMGANAIIVMRFDSAEIGQTMSERQAPLRADRRGHGHTLMFNPGRQRQ